MSTFQHLELDKFYLLKIQEHSEIALIQIAMATEMCVLVYQFAEEDTSYWRKKEDTIAEIIEELTDEMIDEYEDLVLEELEDFEDDYEDDDQEKKKKKKNKK